MLDVATFAAVLLLAVLLSEASNRSILSAAVLFLVAGFVAGDGVLGLVSFEPSSPVVATIAELALFAVLFTDGMRISVHDLISAWQLPGRALLLGMPLAFVAGSLLAHWLVGISWPEAFLVAAVLSPTDPVLAAAIVGRSEIPWRLRHMLNVESGLNDGLALPVVLIMLALIGERSLAPADLLRQVVLGVGIGIVLPLGAAWIERRRIFAIEKSYGPLFVFAVGLLVLSLTSILHANEFLAAFAAGVTMASAHPNLKNQFQGLGENVAELLKLAALLVFGALISPAFLAATPASDYWFALLMLVAVRPVTFAMALTGSRLSWKERTAVAWFGPKGFASVTFGLMIYRAQIPEADRLYHLVALAIVASIIAHSSTDVLLARWLRGPGEEADT